ncbi:TPA: hypothetical protein ACX3EK_003330 [Vibrio parahaemolyticus]|nr:hypothetical protein [Vibrio parahaemolyticus]MBO0167117.1 hypothetical protein [Vibrio parahaemolyticus]MDF4752521.1 hypothetical protein [Vibrio parahaemolyticus]MDF4778635.1 hypothetical protein [Vibrio parahaemolyticus]MDF4786606.1 hypothetical protein [Vibrio parahaemolyticus]MDF4794478.1 hypothetical protein [Vibrio parahaemolyticus]
MNKLKQAGIYCDTIYNGGDQDECAIKHYVNGLCILYVGKDPSDQSLYVDYSDSGVLHSEWEEHRDDEDYEFDSVFYEQEWKSLHKLYNSMSTNQQKQFFKLAYRYGDIENDLWMRFYTR